ncbi:NAD-dependent epimerase/dehydratase family protein [Sphingomonas panacisoli]|uniref:NAD-dependent epimerase/dehydratase family protein n=1 Tax=Sphingomonas panacisoli TaxID=1813879 RepID=A0A5B8LJK4_9SPHN|nr:NAD(P)H-binding protein [Sphingomonas panacisoli]QDZ07945.1 NAD-dependent epimerase/dehydratase family protein [Sphingomonas panacisoli]
MTVIALTGGTGFVGSHVLDQALAAGVELRALTRRPQTERAWVTWISGALDDAASLATLVTGADAVLHVAGVINAADRTGFAAGNIDGTRNVIAAAEQAGIRRFVQVSSIAAREPELSDYGWSKAEADKVLIASNLDWTIVRPPAIFGPRDNEMLELFKLATKHVMPLPPAGGRLSIIAVEELVRLLIALPTSNALTRQIVEPDDGAPDGWDHRNLARAIGVATDSKVLPLPLPRVLLDTISAGDRLVRGKGAKLTPDRVRYFCHKDWVSHARPPADVWAPQIDTRDALAATAAWYRAQGLL